jgi:hypothetical protein
MAVNIHAQEESTGFFFGPKIGPTLGFQNWDGQNRRVMLNYHAAVFIESIDPDFKGALFAQLGYHSRGSGLRFLNVFSGFSASQSIVFRNASFMVGAKKRLLTETLKTPYYFVGLRLEYQLSNNLQDIQDRYNGGSASLYYPLPEFVNDWTYGFSFGGGFEFLGSDFTQPAIELTISPDLSFQYQSPMIPNVINPFNGNPTSLAERKIRNITLELSLVIRFLRKVVYIN